MISYAQNHEDVILQRLFKNRRSGFYIDIGAWDPTVDSTTKHFYDQGWHGINVEPSPTYFAKLASTRPRDVNLNVAIGRSPGRRRFFEFPGTPLSTFKHEVTRAYEKLRHVRNEIEVDVTTLADLCKEHAPDQIDFLKIDVEGWELDVIAGGDWQAFRPRVIVAEALAPYSRLETWRSWDPILVDSGYHFGYFDGLNRFYVRDEDKDLLALLTTPPNLFDGFTLHRVAELEEMLRRLRAEHGALAKSTDDLVPLLERLKPSLGETELRALEAIIRASRALGTTLPE